MKQMSMDYFNAIGASPRWVKAKAELYKNGALAGTYTQSDAIKSIEIQRIGEESKFFGLGVTHKAIIKLVDKTRVINVVEGDYFKINLGVVLPDDSIEYASFPKTFVSEVKRDENTNELSITAYCVLNDAKELIVNDLELTAPYTIGDVVAAIGDKLGASGVCLCDIPATLSDNILPYYSGNTFTSNGITFTKNSDNSITINGTNNGNNNSVYFFVDQRTSGESLTLDVGSTYKASYFEDENIMFVFYDGTYYRSKDGQEFIATENEHIYQQVYIQIPKGNTKTFDNVTIYPSLQKEITLFDLEYPEGANFDGAEKLYEILTAAAEVTQTIYYVNGNDDLVFKRLDYNGSAVGTVDKNRYFNLDSSGFRLLQTIMSATELGDNVSVSIQDDGEIQYVRDNPFWELRDDIDTLVNNALAVAGGAEIYQFNCEWRGDMSFEPGDKIAFVTKDNKKITSYLINDTITFNGGLKEKTEWNYIEQETVSSNPTSLGEALKQTFARVDKANKEIELLASETTANTNAISSMRLNTDSILASVQAIEKTTQEGLNSVHNDVNELSKKVEASITADDVQIQIQSELSNGVSAVKTTTGFTFDEKGLTIGKSESEMKTNIDEDGMSVFRGNDEVLTADNTGVVAYNLKARTYLIIGETSRFEDFTENGEERTGCFWIGETEVE